MTRYSLFPIQFPKLYDKYKAATASFWTVEEVDLSDDIAQFNKLPQAEQKLLSMVLGFFNQADGIVNENLAANFYQKTDIPEARAYYAMQMLQETIHAEMYGLLLDTFIKAPETKAKLFNSIENFPAVGRKAAWAQTWIANMPSLGSGLVAFAAVEGIFFAASFAIIFWFKQRGLLPGLAFANELIAREELDHCAFAVEMSQLYPATHVKEIITEAVEVELSFIESIFEKDLTGITVAQMKEYVRFTADRLLGQFGESPLYGATNPFPFMETLGMETKTNFFEARVGAYQKAGVLSRPEDRQFSLDLDF